jgi:hypothetical protein
MEMDQGLQLALEAFKQSTDYLNSLWNFYAVIALGIVGLIYGGVKVGSVGRARWPVTAGFMVWAFANLGALIREERLRVILASSLHEVAGAVDAPRVWCRF